MQSVDLKKKSQKQMSNWDSDLLCYRFIHTNWIYIYIYINCPHFFRPQLEICQYFIELVYWRNCPHPRWGHSDLYHIAERCYPHYILFVYIIYIYIISVLYNQETKFRRIILLFLFSFLNPMTRKASKNHFHTAPGSSRSPHHRTNPSPWIIHVSK